MDPLLGDPLFGTTRRIEGDRKVTVRACEFKYRSVESEVVFPAVVVPGLLEK